MLRVLSGRSVLIPGVFAFACAVLSSSSAQQSGSQVQEHFLAAQRDHQQGRLDAAAEEYKAVLRLQPGLAEAYVNLGLVYYSQAKFDDSARALARAGQLRPGMRGVSLWLGIDYVKLHRPAQGAALLRDAIRQEPTDKLAQSWLGTALWDSGQRDAALRQLRTAAAHFADDPDLLFAAGEAYGKAVRQQTEELEAAVRGTALSDRIYADLYAAERDWTKAEGHLRRASQRDPRSVDAHLALAEVLFRQGRFQDAKEQLDRAAALAPTSSTGLARILARIGESMILLGQTEEGVARIAKALELDSDEALDALGLPPEDISVEEAEPGIAQQCRQAAARLLSDSADSPARDVALASLAVLAGDEATAMQAYRSISGLPRAPRKTTTLRAQSLEALHAHRYDAAEDDLVRWLALHPADREAEYDLLCVRRKLSMQKIHRLIAIAPDSYHVHQLLGQLYADREEDEKAIAEYRVVAAAHPDLPGIHFWLGHLYWKHGEADDALRELTRELELSPRHPEANGELGAVLVAQGRAADAIPHLESAIHDKSDLWPAYAQLGSAYAAQKEYRRAEEMLRRALAHDSDGSVHYQFGIVLRAEGKSAEAAQAFAQVRIIKNEKIASSLSGDGGTHP